jgi:hypothetical protein
MIVLLILAAIVDLLLAAVLIGVSGFIFGAHEGMNGDPSAAAIWWTGFVACIGAPIVGFVLWFKKNPGIGLFIAVVPIIAAFVVALWPFHPY